MKMEKLKKGDEIRVIAPARSMTLLSEKTIRNAQTRLENLGFIVTFGKNVMESDLDYRSASIKRRIEDLHEAFSDKNVKAILTVIGGYNSNQLLKYIDYDLIKNNPKILCGFSDITVLANAIYKKTGMITYSGPHFSSFGMEKGFGYSLDYFKKMFMEDKPIKIEASKEYSNDEWYLDQNNRKFIKNEGMYIINKGVATGTIIGGNLCSLKLLQGTQYMPNLENTILFIEDDGETGKNFMVEFDRNLESLMQIHGFDKVKGIVIGRPELVSEMTKDKWVKMIKNKKELDNIPVIGGADFGHTMPIFTFPIGGVCNIKAKTNEDIELIISV